MKLSNFYKAMAATAVLAVAGTVNAAPVVVELTYQGYVNGSYTGVVSDSSVPVSKNVGAGLLGFDVKSVTGDSPVNFGQSLEAFCAQFDIRVTIGQTYTYELVDPKASSYFSADVLAKVSQLYNGFYSKVGSRLNDAAFQLALWEIIGEESASLGLTTGNLTAEAFSGARAEADKWLADLSGKSTNTRFWLLVSATAQDLVFIPVPVAEPGTLLLIGSGLLLGVGLRRRKVRS